MNEYIIYTTEGYTTSPNNNNVENCQVLGSVLGENVDDAQKNLIKENPWIKKCGYDISKTICKQLITDEIKYLLKSNQNEIEYLISILDKKQLEDFEKWLLQSSK